MKTAMRQAYLLLSLLASVAVAQFDLPPAPPPPPPPSVSSSTLTLDTGSLTSALDRNVEAIGNLTASNERTVDKLQSTVNTMTASNDRNVAEIVRSADKLLPSLDGLGETTRSALRTWDDSMRPSIDSLSKVGSDAFKSVSDVEKVGRDALGKWDDSIKPSVDGIAKIGRDALKRWDDANLPPKVDDALAKFDDALHIGSSALRRVDDTLAFAKTTLIPIVIVFGTLWVGMCMAGCIAVSCVIAQRQSNSSSYSRLGDSSSSQLQQQKDGMRAKMQSAFHGLLL